MRYHLQWRQRSWSSEIGRRLWDGPSETSGSNDGWYLILIINDRPNPSFVTAAGRRIYHRRTLGDAGNNTAHLDLQLVFTEVVRDGDFRSGAHPPTVSHHSSHFVLAEQLLRHVLHVLQGVWSGLRAAVFDPGTGFPRGGQELEGATPLLIWGNKSTCRWHKILWILSTVQEMYLPPIWNTREWKFCFLWFEV